MASRKESDSVGTLELPDNAYYGVQTLRAYRNFPITGIKQNKTFIKNVALIKKAAATVNGRLGAIPREKADAIIKACDEVVTGKFDGEFITDALQGGAGTSVNMNVNEVVANRATELLGGKKGEYICHPNDDVNRSQSTNDVIPTAGKLTAIELGTELLTSLDGLILSLNDKADEFDGIVKMGRTQLQDAVPVRLGQEFAAYASVLKRDRKRIETALNEAHVVNLGGTAIGTSVNASHGYVSSVAEILSDICGISLKRAENLIDATQNVDCFVAISSSLKTLAVDLAKIANDLRLMSSGPKTGLGEITLPAMQNGSSIMPGKVNPVIPEVVDQVAYLVIGNDVTVSLAAENGQLELNAFCPVMFHRLFESLIALKNAVDTLNENCIKGLTANEKRCNELLMSSVGVVTALCPYIGYKKAAELAKEALSSNKDIKTLVLEKRLLDGDLLDKVLDPKNMTENE